MSPTASFLPPRPSPLTRIDHPLARGAGVKWYAKRDDRYFLAENDPYQGNKVRKMAGILTQLTPNNPADRRLITFGGAFSNHLAATASIGYRLSLATVGIVRGEPLSNPVLDFCRRMNMELHFVSRSQYRQKNEANQVAAYLRQFGPGQLLPEGGSGPWNRVGATTLLREISDQLADSTTFTLQLSAGTGGMAAACIATAEQSNTAAPKTELPSSRPGYFEVFPVLKGGWMRDEILRQLPAATSTPWDTIDGHHWGGYAKRPLALLDFCAEFTAMTSIPLEPVYSGKLFYAVLHRMEAGHYPPGTTLVTYHGGGIFTDP